MQVQIETQNVDIPANGGSRLAERVRRIMRRVSGQIVRLHLTLRDVNGPKGGRAKVCTVRAKLADGGQVIVVDKSDKLPKALFSALRRSRVLIRREIKRRRRRRISRALAVGPRQSSSPHPA